METEEPVGAVELAETVMVVVLLQAGGAWRAGFANKLPNEGLTEEFIGKFGLEDLEQITFTQGAALSLVDTFGLSGELMIAAVLWRSLDGIKSEGVGDGLNLTVF